MSYINPLEPFRPMNINIHKITSDTVASAPTFDLLWPTLRDFIGENMLVAHNADFDICALRATLERYGLATELLSVCSIRMAKVVYPARKSYRLKEFCKEFDIPYGHHKSDADALACAMLTLRMAKDMSTASINELIEKTTADLKGHPNTCSRRTGAGNVGTP